MQLATQSEVNGTIDYSYNNDFQVTSQSINGANTVGFTYDDDGLLTGAGQLAMSYDPQNGLLTGTTLGNFSGSYSYNAFGELTGTAHDYNSSDLFDRTFTRDSLGRITTITETIEGETTLYEYAYNEIGYLVEVKEDGITTAEYEYDANGNRTAYITPTDTVTATYDDQDRMLTYGNASYIYGKRGDLQRKIEGTDTTLYNYDNVGNLRSVRLSDGTVIEYVIDGQDRRVAKKVNGQITKRWLYADGLLPVAELDSAGNMEKQYVPGGVIKNDTTYRILRDHLGSVRLVINSETGEVSQRIDYDAWGNITQLQNQDEFIDIGFAGGLYDNHTGLVRFGARDYDLETGRWTAKDPILFEGGTSNLYEYVLNDPVNIVDPNGLQYLKYNGSNIKLYDQQENLLGSYSATSGIPGEPDYTIVNEGPIPPGTYILDPSEISPTNFFRTFIDPRDWGEYRVPLHPAPATDTETYGRTGFFLHGGVSPGSAGCIDVGTSDTQLFPQLQKINKTMVLHVYY